MEKTFEHGEDWNSLREEINQFLATGVLFKDITCQYQFGGTKVTINYDDPPQDSGKFIALVSHSSIELALKSEIVSYQLSYQVAKVAYASLVPLIGPTFCVAILKV